jgi:hypothetical protein
MCTGLPKMLLSSGSTGRTFTISTPLIGKFNPNTPVKTLQFAYAARSPSILVCLVSLKGQCHEMVVVVRPWSGRLGLN